MFTPDLFNYKRRKTLTVNIGDVPLGSDFPIRIQSMTTIDTLDTKGSVEQSLRMIEAGCEYVRLTAPSLKEAQNLEEIKKELRKKGYKTPLVADIHFTPNAAELAARFVEKVRINPGNYADKKRFETIDYTENEYQNELERIRTKFLPLLKICKEYGTALRIGTNHGSLSDRIMSRFGDNPLGMVESSLEFLKICEDEKFYNVVISMKSSNPQVMVQAYRLLCERLEQEKMKPYPLHLGVTEAGEGEDGRIKSALGIGTLLEDGLGDTIRVSLTEEPELEIPVAKKLVERYENRQKTNFLPSKIPNSYNPFDYSLRKTNEILTIGGMNVPRVIADFSDKKIEKYEDLKPIGHFYLPAIDKWTMNDLGVDFIYLGKNVVENPLSTENHFSLPFMLPNGLKAILDSEIYAKLSKKEHVFPFYQSVDDLNSTSFEEENSIAFLKIEAEDFEKVKPILLEHKNIIGVLYSNAKNPFQRMRNFFFQTIENHITTPIILGNQSKFIENLTENFQLYSATDFGGLLIEGFGNGIWLKGNLEKSFCNSTAFTILQASRTRISKTEYISCPSCGRTLFDLQETTAKIRQRTDHLKGLKIGIMGCIVNGPGEMADADYGYVGMGKDKIALYKGKEVIKRSVPADSAVDELIELIKENGQWIEKE